MATTALGGTTCSTVGELPEVGASAPPFTVHGADFAEVTDAHDGVTVLNIFPSIDTGVCAASVRRFNELAGSLDGARVVTVSADLPFALHRFCAGEGIEQVVATSSFRSRFGDDYGVRLADGGFEGLLARAVVVYDRDGTVRHTELVPDIAREPDYDAAVAAARAHR